MSMALNFNIEICKKRSNSIPILTPAVKISLKKLLIKKKVYSNSQNYNNKFISNQETINKTTANCRRNHPMICSIYLRSILKFRAYNYGIVSQVFKFMRKLNNN